MAPQLGVKIKHLDSDAGLGGLSPNKDIPNNGWATKEKGLGNILSRITELTSPKMVNYRTLGDKKDIFEASLSEGFTFPPREPPRPGQYTNIPQYGIYTKPLSSSPPEQSQNLFGSPPKDRITGSMARASPLDLPELCLPGKSSSIGAAHKHESGVKVTQRKEQISGFFMPPDITKPNDLPGSQCCSPKGTEGLDKTIRLLSPPKLQSSPKQSHHNSLPKAIGHDVVPCGQDDAYHAPRKLSVKTTKSSNLQRQSSPSTCGDLELPVYRSPAKPRHRQSKDPTRRPITNVITKRQEHQSRHRSSSIASSNISKKRSGVNKPREKADCGRKKRAMQQVAEHWNECIKITEEETLEARRDIRKFQDKIQLQEQELENASNLLGQREAKLCELETLNIKLVEDNSQATRENEGLTAKLKSLADNLSEEKNRSKLAHDKCTDYRNKINEVIREQKAHFLHAQTFFRETIAQLREENERKTTSSNDVDKALKSSAKKREEMKKCMEEYRIQMVKDAQQKDQVISELKEKLAIQEALLTQEKSSAEMLRAQSEEQSIAHRCVRALEVKVDSLMARHTIQNEQRESDAQQSTQMMSTLNLKLDSLLAGGNLLASNMISRDNLELKLAAAEKNIVESMLPAILSLENGRSDAANAISQLGASIGRDVDDFKDEASRVMGALKENKERDCMQFQELLSHMQTFNSSLKKAETSFEEMGQKLDTLAGSEQSNQGETIHILQELLQRFSAREISIDDLQRQFQQVHEGFTKNVEAMVSRAKKQGEETTKSVRSATTELRATLEQGLRQEREKTAQLLQGSEDILKGLMARANEQKQLTTQTDHKTSELQATLESEREAAAQLRHQIQRLEQGAQETEDLRDQWLKDVEIIDKVRSQLKALEMRIPHVETCDKKLDRIVEISRSIQSSASYLATEKEWVQLELAGVMPKPAASEPEVSCETTTAALPLLTGPSSVTESQSSIKDDATSRKVTVHSPDPSEKSPSPPPTVMQEQKRRREVTQLRSILKSHALPGAVESGNLEGRSTRPQANPSKAGNPSNGFLNKPPASSAKEMVAEIRSRLLQHDWSFPTVADFERDIQLASRKRHTPQGSPVPLESFDANHRDLKKLRTE
ncbi:hypothetical protein V8C42DRAFT_305219 [Trichoderma barbatum]